jgi:hypothetical protein
MTHQGHSPTTFTCGFTHLGGNDSAKVPRSRGQPRGAATLVTPASRLKVVSAQGRPVCPVRAVVAFGESTAGFPLDLPVRTRILLEVTSGRITSATRLVMKTANATVATSYLPTSDNMISGSHE